MFWVFLLTMIIVGAIAASGFIQSKIEQSKVAFEFSKPYEGWIGLVSLVLGLYWFFELLFNLGTRLKWVPVLTIIYLVAIVVLIVLALMMSKSLLKSLMGENKASEFVDSTAGKFESLKEKLGLVAIGLALLLFIIRIT
ncbi:MAG: hypothetical protein R3F25_12545 [Gammaproteobacteria bacterium]|jgi:hypothetical protein|nr:hypothetical protein [Xanthomonadales bacterium]